ncbi:hypothetical protein PtrEW13061_012153, partial [Pyrenophora tritici-repentis]
REAPEDHISINFRAAWEKLNDYYSKLDDSPAYFAACALHPYYRRYCEKAWQYTTSTPLTKPLKERNNSTINEAISYIISDSEDDNKLTDKYDRWRKLELKWTNHDLKQLYNLTAWEQPSDSMIGMVWSGLV